MMRSRSLFLLLQLFIAWPLGLAASESDPLQTQGDYIIDQARSRVRFEIGHDHYSKRVKGGFERVAGRITLEPAGGFELVVSIDASSLATDNDYRDNHLKLAFFETDRFPELEFSAEGAVSDDEIAGLLTIKGITRPVTLELAGGGTFSDARGRRGIRYRATATIDRQAFGVRESSVARSRFQRVLQGVRETLDELIHDRVDVTIMVVAYRHERGDE